MSTSQTDVNQGGVYDKFESLYAKLQSIDGNMDNTLELLKENKKIEEDLGKNLALLKENVALTKLIIEENVAQTKLITETLAKQKSITEKSA